MNNPFYNRLLAVASFLGALGVIAGAFGAHFLKSRLEVKDLETLKTAVLYLFVHVLVSLFICSIARSANPSRWLKIAGISFIIGIIFFSGSLFIIGTASLTQFPVSMIGIITPIGGLFFICGWIALAVSGIVKRPIH